MAGGAWILVVSANKAAIQRGLDRRQRRSTKPAQKFTRRRNGRGSARVSRVMPVRLGRFKR
jgi:hypothetical protein